MATTWATYHGTTAVKRALNMVGKSYGVGWCQKFTNEIFQTGSVGDYDGDGDADAIDGWKKAVAHGKVVKAAKIKKLADIPAGVMLYWSGGGRGYGHAAVGVGGGNMVSTDLPTSGRVGKVPISRAHTQWGLTFLGYVMTEGNGHVLVQTPPKKAETTKGAIYIVTSKTGLIARKAANGDVVKRDGHTLVRPPGFSLRIVDTKNAGGRSWSRGSSGLWYATQYLKKR